MAFRKAFLIFVAAALSGCGYLSNDPFYEGGYGSVTGRLVVDGQPLEGTLVFAMQEEVTTVTTGPDGTFDLSMVPSGRDRGVVAMWGTNLGMQARFDLPSKGEILLGDIELKPLGLLEGHVDMPDPQLAEVSILQTPFVTRPDNTGRFLIRLPEGTWGLEVSAEGFLPATIDEVVTDIGETEVLSGSVQPEIDQEYVCEDVKLARERYYQGGRGTVDVLFIVDNSGSMVGEQKALGDSIRQFTGWLKAGEMDYRIAVITSGMESIGCPPCQPPAIPGSCMNDTGENGRFQDRVCRNEGSIDYPDYVCHSDMGCRVVDETNLACFYDDATPEGVVFVGVNGCGYERGLASMRQALTQDLLYTWNDGFLRPEAKLAVIVVSDEDDCGEVGDVSENIGSAMGNMCYFAAKGVGPDGEAVHPDDPDQKPYGLTPVSEYAGFLWDLKEGTGLVTFSAIVGVSDPLFPLNTRIEYYWDDDRARWDIEHACTTPEPDCTGRYCFSKPGTRYIELANMTGGAVETICQTDFSEPMERVLGTSTNFRRTFPLSKSPTSVEDILVAVDGASNSDWQFLPEKRAIVFSDDQIPKPYSMVEVEYLSPCP